MIKQMSVALLLGLSVAGFARAETNVAFVNTAVVLQNAPQAAAASEKLNQEFAVRKESVVAEQKKLKSMQDKLQRDGMVMSEEERRKLEREIVNQEREIKRTVDALNEDFNLRRNEELGRVLETINKVIESLASKNKYDLILDKNNVIYASKRVDITATVLEALNAEAKK